MKYLVLLFSILLFLSGCSENDSTSPGTGNGRLKLLMTDAPAIYDSVIIFINRVEVHLSDAGDEEGWFIINNNPDRYDLLLLRNGATVILGEADLAPGHYSQIRLILDSQSYIVVNGVSHPLTIPSGFQTGIKLNHEFDIEPDILYELLLDFDADKSIHLTGSDKYMMNPVIRIIPIAIAGSISGRILPENTGATVSAITPLNDTISTFTSGNGFFKISGLNEDEYDIYIFSVNGSYKDSLIMDVKVFADSDTDIGTIVLQNN